MVVGFLFVGSNYFIVDNHEAHATQEDTRVERLMDLLVRINRLVRFIEERESVGEDTEGLLLLKIQLIEMRLEVEMILKELIRDIKRDLWSINIISPQSGDVLYAGKTYNIEWNSFLVDNIRLSVCGETPLLPEKYTCWDLSGPSIIDASLERYSWRVDSNAPWVPGTVRIRITDTDTGRYVESSSFRVKEDVTDREKRILDCRFDIIMAQLFARDRICELYSNSVTLDCYGLHTYSTNNGCVVESLKKTGWTVQSEERYPSISIISPNGGETWATGGRYNITWESKNIDKVAIYLTNYSCSSELTKTIAKGINASSGRYTYQVPQDFFTSSDGYCHLRGDFEGWKSGYNFKVQVVETKDYGAVTTLGVSSESSRFFKILDFSNLRPIAQGSLRCAGLEETSVDIDVSFSNTGLDVTLFRDNHRVWGWDMDRASSERRHNEIVTSRNLTPNTRYVYRLVNGTRTTSPELARVVCRTAHSSRLTAKIDDFIIRYSETGAPFYHHYLPNENIVAFVSGTMSNGLPADPNSGFHAQAGVYHEEVVGISTAISGVSGTYDSRKKRWDILARAPSSAGNYRLIVGVFCSKPNASCDYYGIDRQDERSFEFTVFDSKLSMILEKLRASLTSLQKAR